MTQAYNLSQLANNLNTAGQLDATDGLVNAVPVANGGTGATNEAAARTNLNVPTRTGGDASGTWAINISGNAANGGVTSVNGATGAVSVPVGISQQLFLGSGTFVVPAGVTAVYATVMGGGGGGQGGGSSGNGGENGGFSLSQTVLVTGLTPGASIPVTVGAGGAGGAGNSINGVNGTTGGTSSFGSYVSVTGGFGGGTGASSTITSSYIKQTQAMTGNGGSSGPSQFEGYVGGGGGGAGWSSGGGGGAASYSLAPAFGAGGAAFNGSAGFPGITATSGAASTAGGAGGSNPGGASGGAAAAGGTNTGGGGGGGGAGAVLLRW
jgi:hypothetical protein